MKTYIDDGYIYVKNKCGQHCTIEYSAEGLVVSETSEVPPYDWQGVYVDDVEVTEISFWLDSQDSGSPGFKLTWNQLKKVLSQDQFEKFENKVDEALQEEACQSR